MFYICGLTETTHEALYEIALDEILSSYVSVAIAKKKSRTNYRVVCSLHKRYNIYSTIPQCGVARSGGLTVNVVELYGVPKEKKEKRGTGCFINIHGQTRA